MLRTWLRRLLSRTPPMLEVGTPAPPFEALDHQGRRVTLAELSGRRFVLWFYPKADTPGCTRQGCGFRDAHAELAAKGVEVLGVSFDTVEEVRAFAEKHGFPYRLLADPERAMGLAYRACDAATDDYARRITYVVGPDGRIERAIATQDPGAQAGSLVDTLP